ncbi:50S ribosomal protein L23 [Phanerochaete sordida]|uniref:Large ribosomal subunit protein uL23m n=1 Tax=Phanerochaete sordida TaxID=48140 RepID=A0A9P3G9G6_9APHY|nr:50S ribosomal protein L23 [Phanerochaete sordida]
MQVFRRLYSSLPEAAAVARTASTPRAVRLRRLRKRPVAPGQSDANPDGLTPTEHARFQRDLAKGELVGPTGAYLTEGEWLERLDSRRTRIRGTRAVTNEAGEAEVEVVGQRIYLPNVVFQLMRNFTPPGQPYNPYEATFRVPPSITKTDVRSYLQAVYGVKTTYIRTDNYMPKLNRIGQQMAKAYKRAVVGLVEPFYFPKATEDMNVGDREAREKWLEDTFQTKDRLNTMKSEMLRMSRKHSEGWRWRTATTAKRSNIVRLIAERRAQREQAILSVKERIRAARIDIEP